MSQIKVNLIECLNLQKESDYLEVLYLHQKSYLEVLYLHQKSYLEVLYLHQKSYLEVLFSIPGVPIENKTVKGGGLL